MNIDQTRFFKLFGPGIPETCPVTDLDDMAYGSLDDRRALLALARHVQPTTVIEFGVQAGTTARLLLDEIPRIRKYIGIDLPADELPALEGQNPEVPAVPGRLVFDHPAFTLLQARSETLKPKQLPKADLIYIDGGHDQATVRADTLLALDRIKPNGIIVWHDYHNHSVQVTQAIDNINQTTGDHICLIDGTWIVFLLASAIEVA